jgi:hypothetical protein
MSRPINPALSSYLLTFTVLTRREPQKSQTKSLPAGGSAGTSVATGTKRKLSRGGTEPQKNKGKQADEGEEPYDPEARKDASGNPKRNTNENVVSALWNDF